MIAPLKQSPVRSSEQASSLSAARKALAAVLFKRPAPTRPRAPVVGTTVACLFIAWLVAVAVSYLAIPAWWAITFN